MKLIEIQQTEGPKLFTHQLQAIEALKQYFEPETLCKKGMLVMPTGSGKTMTAVHYLLSERIAKGECVLWLVHRNELIEQAAKTFERLSGLLYPCDKKLLKICKISGTHHNEAFIHQSDVVIASIFSLTEFPNVPKLTVVIDEAHHGVARAYKNALKRLDQSGIHYDLIGLTATPSRLVEHETQKLLKLFDVLKHGFIYEVDPKTLIAANILALPMYERIQTTLEGERDFDITDSQLKLLFNEKDPQPILNKIAKHQGRNELIVNHYVAHREKYKKTIVFAINVRQAKRLQQLFLEAGVSCLCCVSGEKNLPLIIEQFKKESFEVMVNVMMLCEGSDIPAVQTVFLARPTKSKSLLIQMIGRALRGVPSGGTESAYVVDFYDQWNQVDCWLNSEKVMKLYLGDSSLKVSCEKTGDRTLTIDEQIYDLLYERLNKAGSCEVVAEMIPCGWYEVEDYKGIQHYIFVYHHEVDGYLAMEKEVKALASNRVDGNVLFRKYFNNQGMPPKKSDLELIGFHLNVTKKMPSFQYFKHQAMFTGQTFLNECVRQAVQKESLSFEYGLRKYFENHSVLLKVFESYDQYRQTVLLQMAKG